MQVQKPVRYYITKHGDEPTVRSVAVALPAVDRDLRAESGASTPDAVVARKAETRRVGVTHRVKGVLKKRSVRP